MGSISFISESIKFSLPQKKVVKNWIQDAIICEHKNTGDISVVFCSDDYILSVNNQYLKHDYYTDIITFDYCEGNIVSGDLLISIDRVKENASDRGELFIDELHRVIIHGILHLVGYKDKTEMESNQMREKENYYLQKRI
jgi:rRNA maturation RNase YbeY